MISFHLKPFQIEVYNKFEAVELEWSKFVEENPSLGKGNLETVENSAVSRITPYYLLVKEKGITVGIIYYQLLRFNSSFIDLGWLNKWYLGFIRYIVQRFEIKLLICGNLFRINFKGFAGIRADVAAQITKKIAEQKLLKINICGILMKDLEKPLKLTIAKRYGYKQMHDDITMLMKVSENWKNFQDYIAALSRKYRKRAEKIIQAGSTLVRKNLSLEEITHYQNEIENLYLQVAHNQTVRLGILNQLYFINMKKNLKDSFELIGYFDKEKLVAFSSYIYYESHVEIHYIGFSYAQNNQFQLYFNILFDGLKEALSKGFKKIELGRTAKEAKASLGASPVENLNYFCINNPILSQIYKKIQDKFSTQMGENWANRNPLK